jgi:hypothetical protein
MISLSFAGSASNSLCLGEASVAEAATRGGNAGRHDSPIL